jgi:hypothetical protein
MFVLVAAALALGAMPSTSPAQLLQQIIRYETQDAAGVRDRAFLAFFTPALRRAIQRETAGSAVGMLDYDPLCDCQDNGGLKMRLISVRHRGAIAAARLEARSAGHRKTITLTLRRLGRDWKVADVSTPNRPSLASALSR